MSYKTQNMDFERILSGTRSLDDPRIKRSKYIDTYAALEMQVRDKGLAQSLPEYLATQYWLMNLSANKIADKFADMAISHDPNFVRQVMMAELNIPRRKGSKGSRKAV